MTRNLITLTSLIIVGFLLSYLFPGQTSFKVPQTAGPPQMEKEGHPIKKPIEKLNKMLPPLTAKSACVFDLSKNHYLFELNAEAQLPLASLTKLMTALVAKENLPQGILIKITKEALAQEGDTGLKRDEYWNLNDITDIMLISSSNDAAFAIASSLSKDIEPDTTEFLALMNKKAQALRMEQTHFFNSTGLDISDNLSGAYGSCKDMTKLMTYILKKHPGLLEVTTYPSIKLKGRVFKNTDKLLSQLPLLLASKTGYDDLAGGNLIIVVNKGLKHPLIIAVLGSTIEGRFEDVHKLYNYFVK